MIDLWEVAEKHVNVIVAYAGAITAAIGGTIAWFSGRRAASRAADVEAHRVQLDGFKELLSSARENVAQIRAQLTLAEKRLDECEADRRNLWIEITKLRAER